MEEDIVFISYSSKDKEWMEEVLESLLPLEDDYEVEIWVDKKKEYDRPYPKKIDIAINRTRVVVLLISSNFVESGFIMNKELPAFVDRYTDCSAGIKIDIIPLMVSSISLEPYEMLKEKDFFNKEQDLRSYKYESKELPAKLTELRQAVEKSLTPRKQNESSINSHFKPLKLARLIARLNFSDITFEQQATDNGLKFNTIGGISFEQLFALVKLIDEKGEQQYYTLINQRDVKKLNYRSSHLSAIFDVVKELTVEYVLKNCQRYDSRDPLVSNKSPDVLLTLGALAFNSISTMPYIEILEMLTVDKQDILPEDKAKIRQQIYSKAMNGENARLNRDYSFKESFWAFAYAAIWLLEIIKLSPLNRMQAIDKLLTLENQSTIYTIVIQALRFDESFAAALKVRCEDEVNSNNPDIKRLITYLHLLEDSRLVDKNYIINKCEHLLIERQLNFADEMLSLTSCGSDEYFKWYSDERVSLTILPVLVRGIGYLDDDARLPVSVTHEKRNLLASQAITAKVEDIHKIINDCKKNQRQKFKRLWLDCLPPNLSDGQIQFLITMVVNEDDEEVYAHAIDKLISYPNLYSKHVKQLISQQSDVEYINFIDIIEKVAQQSKSNNYQDFIKYINSH